MILIFTLSVSPRLSYIFHFIFSEILKTKISFTSDIEHFSGFQGAKLVYGETNPGDFVFFQSSGFLSEKDIAIQKIDWVEWEGMKAFFPVSAGVLPFDPFSAAFYLLSRYEEYLPHQKDRHGRFSPKSSLAFKGDFLDKPVINIWATFIRQILIKAFPEQVFPVPSYSFIPTIDIDNAYAYKNKGIIKIFFKLIKDLLYLRSEAFVKKLKVLAGLSRDPFDSYEKQQTIHSKYNIAPLYFILMGNKGKYDRNLTYKNKALRNLVKDLNKTGTVGLHPSYLSNSDVSILKAEKAMLEDILQEKVSKSRQHYIKISLPKTYQNLISLGISEDYSMGYPSVSGFRAGTSTPFYFYNLQEEEISSLKVFPFVFMDTTLKVYLKKRSKDIIPCLKPYIEVVKQYGGCLSFIFHNESLGCCGKWKNWNGIYEEIIRLCIDNK